MFTERVTTKATASTATVEDRQYMAHAVQLAQGGLYSTSPNPKVGCVLVKADTVIGEGFHQKAGEGHAEVNAIATVTKIEDLQGACAYVTLEPCSHTGKTPPCADALIKAGIKRVVVGMVDPNPQVAGQGINKLKTAGIEVVTPLLKTECKALNPGFIKRMKTGKPRVFAKTASSLDGRTAMQSGESQWITGSAARADVQKLRAQSCAIITGIGTVLNDNAALTVRDKSLALTTQDGNQELRQPLRVLLDSHLRVPLDAKIFQPPGQCLVVFAKENKDKLAALQGKGIETLQLANNDDQVDLPALLTELSKRQCNDVMVEAGAGLTGAFLQAELLDEMFIYMAATLMGSDAQPIAQLPLTAMQQQLRLQVDDIRRVGDDFRWLVRPLYEKKIDKVL